MDLNHLRTFALVGRLGALAAAARSLGVPTSTVSRHLRRLEGALGVDLVHRGPRRITLTDAGVELLRLSAAPLSELEVLALSATPKRGWCIQWRDTIPVLTNR